MKFSHVILTCGLALTLGACSGMQKSNGQVTAHAESLNLIGFQIPENPHPVAMGKLPSGTQIHTVKANPSDWTSFLGVLNRIIGVSYVEVSGQTSK